MTRLPQLAASPMAWRIVIAALLAIAILIFARAPDLEGPGPARFPEAIAKLARPGAQMPPPLPDTAQSLPIATQEARASNANVPIADLHPVLAAPFRFTGAPSERARARDCLAAAAWYEAGDDPAGERSVVQVVINRARHPAFPRSVCGVVFQGSERTTGCQFSFTCDGSLARIPSPAAWSRARAIAGAALTGAVDARVGLATHYHADYVVPRWRDELVKTAQQGAHLFYRWPGYWGSAAAMARTTPSDIEPTVASIASLSPEHAPTLVGAPELVAVPQPANLAAVRLVLPPEIAQAALDMQLDLAAPPGSYALKALALCGDAADCRVAGRIAQEVAFVYVRKGAGGGEGAYWDCRRFRRSDRAQCLPGSAPAPDRLFASN